MQVKAPLSSLALNPLVCLNLKFIFSVSIPDRDSHLHAFIRMLFLWKYFVFPVFKKVFDELLLYFSSPCKILLYTYSFFSFS